MLVYVKQVLQTYEKQLDWAPAETPTKIAGLGNSRNIFGRIGHQQKHFRQYCWNHKLHIVGKLQGLRPCNFQWNSWKLGTSISFLLWENCRGFAPAIFRGTLGNWGIHNFRYWNSWISKCAIGHNPKCSIGHQQNIPS